MADKYEVMNRTGAVVMVTAESFSITEEGHLYFNTEGKVTSGFREWDWFRKNR